MDSDINRSSEAQISVLRHQYLKTNTSVYPSLLLPIQRLYMPLAFPLTGDGDNFKFQYAISEPSKTLTTHL